MNAVHLPHNMMIAGHLHHMARHHRYASRVPVNRTLFTRLTSDGNRENEHKVQRLHYLDRKRASRLTDPPSITTTTTAAATSVPGLMSPIKLPPPALSAHAASNVYDSHSISLASNIPHQKAALIIDSQQQPPTTLTSSYSIETGTTSPHTRYPLTLNSLTSLPSLPSSTYIHSYAAVASPASGREEGWNNVLHEARESSSDTTTRTAVEVLPALLEPLSKIQKMLEWIHANNNADAWNSRTMVEYTNILQSDTLKQWCEHHAQYIRDVFFFVEQGDMPTSVSVQRQPSWNVKHAMLSLGWQLFAKLTGRPADVTMHHWPTFSLELHILHNAVDLLRRVTHIHQHVALVMTSVLPAGLVPSSSGSGDTFSTMAMLKHAIFTLRNLSVDNPTQFVKFINESMLLAAEPTQDDTKHQSLSSILLEHVFVPTSQVLRFDHDDDDDDHGRDSATSGVMRRKNKEEPLNGDGIHDIRLQLIVPMQSLWIKTSRGSCDPWTRYLIRYLPSLVEWFIKTGHSIRTIVTPPTSLKNMTASIQTTSASLRSGGRALTDAGVGGYQRPSSFQEIHKLRMDWLLAMMEVLHTSIAGPQRGHSGLTHTRLDYLFREDGATAIDPMTMTTTTTRNAKAFTHDLFSHHHIPSSYPSARPSAEWLHRDGENDDSKRTPPTPTYAWESTATFVTSAKPTASASFPTASQIGLTLLTSFTELIQFGATRTGGNLEILIRVLSCLHVLLISAANVSFIPLLQLNIRQRVHDQPLLRTIPWVSAIAGTILSTENVKSQHSWTVTPMCTHEARWYSLSMLFISIAPQSIRHTGYTSYSQMYRAILSCEVLHLLCGYVVRPDTLAPLLSEMACYILFLPTVPEHLLQNYRMFEQSATTMTPPLDDVFSSASTLGGDAASLCSPPQRFESKGIRGVALETDGAYPRWLTRLSAAETRDKNFWSRAHVFPWCTTKLWYNRFVDMTIAYASQIRDPHRLRIGLELVLYLVKHGICVNGQAKVTDDVLAECGPSARIRIEEAVEFVASHLETLASSSVTSNYDVQHSGLWKLLEHVQLALEGLPVATEY